MCKYCEDAALIGNATNCEPNEPFIASDGDESSFSGRLAYYGYCGWVIDIEGDVYDGSYSRVESSASLCGISFCPFCGARLP